MPSINPLSSTVAKPRKIRTIYKIKHGHNRKHKRTTTYNSWTGMIQRCTNPNSKKFPIYGGRGIKICERWLDFYNFLADMGQRPRGTQIDRKNNDGNYEPGNCRWASLAQQAKNKSNIHQFTIRGVTGCIVELCNHFNVPYSRTISRRYKGWGLEQAIFEPDWFSPKRNKIRRLDEPPAASWKTVPPQA